MARSLSANVTAGIGGDSSPVWLVELESASTTYRWASADCNSTDVPAWTGDAFEGGRIARDGLGEIVYKIDLSRGGNIADLASWEFSLRNEDLYSDTLSSEFFLGRRVELRLIFIDKAGPSWGNAARIFKGYISEPPQWTEKLITFKASSAWLSKHRILPPRQLSREVMPNLPEDNVGARVPIVLGDFTLGLGVNRSGIASNRSPAASEVILRDYFPGLFDRPLQRAGLSVDYGTHAIFADHELHTFPLPYQASAKFLYNTERACWVRADVSADTFIKAGERYSGLVSLHVYPGGSTPCTQYTHLIPLPDYVATSGASNVENAIDEDDSNYTTLDANGEIASYEIPGVFGRGDEVSSSLVFWADAIARTDDKLQYRINGGAWIDCPGYGSFQIVVGPTPSNGVFTGERVEFKYQDVGGHDAGCAFRLRSVYLSLSTAGEKPSSRVYETGKGLIYERWIDSASHVTPKSAGDLIENPAAAVEALLAHYLDINPAKTTGAVSLSGSQALTLRHSESFDALNAQKFTISAWVYITESPISTPHYIARKCNGLAGQYANPFDFFINSGAHLALSIGDGAANYSAATPGTISPNTWTHVAATWDGTTITLYINGSSAATATPGGSMVNGTDHGSLGGLGYLASGGLSGYIDELAVWSVQKDSSAISTIYASGAGRYELGGQDGLLMLLHFDEGSGKFIRDASAQENHALYYTGHSWVAGKVETPQGLNEAAFDDLHSNKSNLKLASIVSILTDAKISSELIREICSEFFMGFFEDGGGLASLGRLEANGTPGAIGPASFLVDGKGNSTFKITHGKLSGVRNEFHVFYRRNADSRNYEGYLYCKTPHAANFESGFCNFSSDAETYWGKCRASFVETQQTLRIDLKLNWIRDDVTAEAYAKAAISWLAKIPLFVSFASPLSLLEVELLDNKRLTHALLPPDYDSGTLGAQQFRLVEQRIAPNTNRLGHVWRSVGNSTLTPPSLSLPGSLSPTLDLNADSLDLLDSDLVSTWASDSGSVSFTAAGAARPTFSATNGPTGGACVDFDGAANVLTSPTKLGDVGAADGFSLFAVCAVTALNPSNPNRFLQDTLLTDSGANAALTFNSASDAYAVNNDGATDSSGGTFKEGEWVIVELHHAGGLIGVVNNGVSAATAASGNTAALSGTLILGVDSTSTYFLKGALARLVCYSGTLTEDERKLVREALNTLYGIY